MSTTSTSLLNVVFHFKDTPKYGAFDELGTPLLLQMDIKDTVLNPFFPAKIAYGPSEHLMVNQFSACRLLYGPLMYLANTHQCTSLNEVDRVSSLRVLHLLNTMKIPRTAAQIPSLFDLPLWIPESNDLH